MVKEIKQITLKMAKKMIEKSIVKAAEVNVSVVVSIVDAGGNLLAMERMDDAFVTSIAIANDKAFTAWAVKCGTDELTDFIQPGQSLFGLNVTNNGRMVCFGGGFPIKLDGQIIGAIGVSGGTVEEDMAIAKAAFEIL